MSRRRAPNQLLVIWDCARAQSLDPAAGGPVARTPRFDALRRHGTSFSRAVAPGNWTLPSHQSILTGTYPWVHRLRTFGHPPVAVPQISAWLAAHGYETALFTEEIHLVSGYGLEEGYGHRWSTIPASSDEERTRSNRLFGHARWAYAPAALRLLGRFPRLAGPMSAWNYREELRFKRRVCDDRLGERFGAWLDGRDPARPFHALVNFVDAHEPYTDLPIRPFDMARRGGLVQVPRFYLLSVPGLAERMPWDRVEAAYRRAIERADRKLGALLDHLERVGEGDRTMVIVTADHGQSFGEGGNIYHGCGATDSVLRVPLVVRPPAGIERIERVEEWTSLCEIPSWMRSAAVGQAPFLPDGLAPVPFPAEPPRTTAVLAEGGPASDPNRSLAAISPGSSWNHRLVAAYRGSEKWVWDTTTGALDRWETRVGFTVGAAEPVPPGARDRLLAEVFGMRSEEARDRFRSPTKRTATGSALGAERMRSWGYD